MPYSQEEMQQVWFCVLYRHDFQSHCVGYDVQSELVNRFINCHTLFPKNMRLA